MTKKILILVDNSRRDLIWVNLLKLEFEKRESNIVKLCNKRNVIIELLDFLPEIFIVSRADYHYVKNLKGLCNIYIVPGEGARLTAESALGVFLGRAYTPDRLHDLSFVDKAYVWGNQIKDWLKETKLFKDSQLFVSGNCRLDVYKKKKYFKKRNITRKQIGIAVSTKTTTSYYGDQHFPEVYYNMQEEDKYPTLQENKFFEENVWRDHAILRITMELIKKILNETDLDISVRVGPFEDINEFKFLNKLYPDRITVEHPDQLLAEWLRNIDLVLTCRSTTGLEAQIAQIPVIAYEYLIGYENLIRSFKPKECGFEDIMPCFHTPKNKNEVIYLINKFLDNKLKVYGNESHFNNFMKDVYDWEGCDNSNVAEIITEDIINHSTSKNIEKSDRKLWKNKIDNNFIKFLNIFLPLIVSIKIVKLINPIRFFISDYFSSNFIGNRGHYKLHNNEISTFLKSIRDD